MRAPLKVSQIYLNITPYLERFSPPLTIKLKIDNSSKRQSDLDTPSKKPKLERDSPSLRSDSSQTSSSPGSDEEVEQQNPIASAAMMVSCFGQNPFT